MITDADIKKLKVVFATKDDLQKMESGIRHDMATKDDLKRFATKEDLKGFATKDDLRSFATKEDLQRFATKEDLKRFATKEDVQEIVNESTLGIVEGVKTIIDMLGETNRPYHPR